MLSTHVYEETTAYKDDRLLTMLRNVLRPSQCVAQ